MGVGGCVSLMLWRYWVEAGFGGTDAWFAWGEECSLITGEGGLQFCDLREGEGKSASPQSFVRYMPLFH